jgi:hypothetical protein
MKITDRYVKMVCDRLTLPVEDVTGKRRDRELCEARQVISYILKQYTRLSLKAIACKVGYKCHASVIRDSRIVPDLLINKQYNAKYSPILTEARVVAERIEKEQKALLTGIPHLPGDICWFWNTGTQDRFPVIGTFDRIITDGDVIKYLCRELPDFSYTECLFVGDNILPAAFRGRVTMPQGRPAHPAPMLPAVRITRKAELCTTY